MPQSKTKEHGNQISCQNNDAASAKTAITTPKTQKQTKKCKKRAKKSQNPKPIPKNEPRPGSPEFKKLQDHWYAKLKAEGFNDFERPHPRTGDQSQAWFNGKSLQTIATTYDGATLEYYRRMTCYLAHRPRWSTDRFERFAARLYAQGISYSKIVAEARKRLIKHNANKWHVHKAIKRFEALALAWNRTSKHGLDFVADLGD